MARPGPALLKDILDTSTPTNRSPFSRGLQRETKRAAVLSCAAKLFNTKGARSTTLADVASRLGLTKTSLYYYVCLLYTSPSPRDMRRSRMPSSA